MIKLNAELARCIGDEGEKAYPDECCGFVLGKPPEPSGGREVERLIPIVNAREAEERYHRFKIEPEDFMKAEKAARLEGREIIGFYHSHPDHPARPSGYDREQALPFYSYLIVAVKRGRAGALTSWELSVDRSCFIEEDITWR
ncbi:MAG: M67 family metallopeptidase [Treponema sp.]|nr:M67 family metallopeptidase [Treponema sp.]